MCRKQGARDKGALDSITVRWWVTAHFEVISAGLKVR